MDYTEFGYEDPAEAAEAAVVERPTASIDRLFRHESGRAVATLIRVLGDFDLAEEAVQEAWVVALERWPAEGTPDNPGAWITRVARNKAIDRLRRESRLSEKLAELERLEQAPRTAPGDARTRSRGRARRSSPADLHDLSPGACPRGPGRAHAAHPRRAHHSRDRSRLPRLREHDGPAAGARQAQDPRRPYPLRGAVRRAAARASRLRARRPLPDLQRGLLGDGRR